ncbi:hypothetical protein B0F90DRAFT_1665589 [Multifurca ochricompacta]|uniref:Uncharacterized protein n=1 Tax=Multifurca ochricompacta TaxID=376703 RepID=A0AAD4MC68_9AGAM|nr:hypothetical protein B0F90DRAFT_1665589 [Multifurca ochricompacta]
MGKNKYDLVKRREKILKKMARPLYDKPNNSTYLVITQPFGMQQNPTARGAIDVNRLSSWISWVSRRQSVVEAVYTMSTTISGLLQKDEIIVKISEGVDTALLLGKHKYCNILTKSWPVDPGLESCVFEYNYQCNGDPAGHNWREYIGSDVHVPPGYFRDPYPVPTWAVRPPQLVGLVHSLPGSLPRTPSPEPLPETSNHSQKDVKMEPNHSFYKTYNAVPDPAKVDYPNHPDSSIKYEAPVNVSVKREQVFQVKHEPSDMKLTLSQSGNEDPQGTGVGPSGVRELGVKQEPENAQSIACTPGPSQALWSEWSRYQSQHVLAAPVEHEANTPQSSIVTQSLRTTGSFTFVPKVLGPLPSFKTKREQPGGEVLEEAQDGKKQCIRDVELDLYCPSTLASCKTSRYLIVMIVQTIIVDISCELLYNVT